jgi:hypothetical protein
MFYVALAEISSGRLITGMKSHSPLHHGADRGWTC